MNSIRASKWTKAGAFLVCLLPLAALGWRAWKQELGANPIELVTHATGDWALRFLLITLAVTPTSKILSMPRFTLFRRMLGLFAFFYGCLHFLTYLWLDKFFDLSEILGDIGKRPFITIGFTSLMLMVPLAATSTAGWIKRLGPRRWQWLHRLIYISAFAAVIHYYWLVKSDIRLPALYGAILLLLLTARMLRSRTSPARKTTGLRLLSIKRQTKDTVSLRFLMSGSQRLGARPGQFLTFDWIVDGKKLPRSYSISSSPLRTGYVEIAVKEQGIVSAFLNRDARVGLTVEAHGPYGQFYFDERQHRSVALFAGGSGITPIMSMLRYIEETAPDTEIKLFYAVRTGQDIIFKEDLEKLQKRLPRFRYLVVASRPDMRWHGTRGYVNRALIVEHLGQISDQTFFVCGPAGFMATVKEILTSLGVRDEHILQERFTIAALGVESSAASTCTVDFTKSRRKYEGSSAETLLMIAEKHGIEVPYSCRVGQCGTCATRVLDGEVEMDVEEGLESGLRAQGYRLLCVGHARGLVSLDA